MKFSTNVFGQSRAEHPSEPVVGGVSHTLSPCVWQFDSVAQEEVLLKVCSRPR